MILIILTLFSIKWTPKRTAPPSDWVVQGGLDPALVFELVDPLYNNELLLKPSHLIRNHFVFLFLTKFPQDSIASIAIVFSRTLSTVQRFKPLASLGVKPRFLTATLLGEQKKAAITFFPQT